MSTDIVSALQKHFPADAVITKNEDLTAYSYDGTPVIKEMPRAVVFATTPEEVATVLRLATETGTNVSTRGSGTGLSGGCIPQDGGIVLCLARMDKIIELDTANLTMLVEPGVINANIAAAAEAEGLFYPPDPGSMRISTIGGNVAENSGGLRGLKYGITRDYVMGLEIVLATGETFFTGTKCVKDVAGYSMKDLFVGSEGTLGVVTKVLLKLVPKPAARKTLLAIYEKMDEAAATVSAIIADKIIPCTAEFLDRTTIKCVEDYANIGLPLDCEAVLILETDGHPAAVEDEARRMEELCKEHGARSVKLAADLEEATKLMTARRLAFPRWLAWRRRRFSKTPPCRAAAREMVRFVQQTADKYKIQVGTFGHIGDGNLHPPFLANELNHDEMHRVDEAVGEIFDYAVKIGGTISGEHGIGLTKKRYLPGAIGELNVRVLKELKRVFDPKGILNPGKIFDSDQPGMDGPAFTHMISRGVTPEHLIPQT